MRPRPPQGAASIDQRAGNFVFHLDGTFRRADDYNIPVEGESRAQLAEEGEEVPDDFNENRELDNSFVESSSIAAGVSYVGERGFFGIAISDFNSTYGLPGGHGHEDEEHEEEHDEDEDHGLRAPAKSELFSKMKALKFVPKSFKLPVAAGELHMACNFENEISRPLAKRHLLRRP